MKKLLFWLTFFSLAVIGCSSDNDPVDPSSSGRNNNNNNTNNCKKTNCADYTSQAAAQAAFDYDPKCHDDLDLDNDGIACEEPGNAVSKNDCPNTSNCGCSGKTKANCPNDPCCKWVVGDGCNCK